MVNRSIYAWFIVSIILLLISFMNMDDRLFLPSEMLIIVYLLILVIEVITINKVLKEGRGA